MFKKLEPILLLLLTVATSCSLVGAAAAQEIDSCGLITNGFVVHFPKEFEPVKVNYPGVLCTFRTSSGYPTITITTQSTPVTRPDQKLSDAFIESFKKVGITDVSVASEGQVSIGQSDTTPVVYLNYTLQNTAWRAAVVSLNNEERYIVLTYVTPSTEDFTSFNQFLKGLTLGEFAPSVSSTGSSSTTKLWLMLGSAIIAPIGIGLFLKRCWAKANVS